MFHWTRFAMKKRNLNQALRESVTLEDIVGEMLKEERSRKEQKHEYFKGNPRHEIL